jgi:hypothetical protein
MRVSAGSTKSHVGRPRRTFAAVTAWISHSSKPPTPATTIEEYLDRVELRYRSAARRYGVLYLPAMKGVWIRSLGVLAYG